jgi:hypothetical protein
LLGNHNENKKILNITRYRISAFGTEETVYYPRRMVGLLGVKRPLSLVRGTAARDAERT